MGKLRRLFEQVVAEKSPLVVVGLGISGAGALELCRDLGVPAVAIEALPEASYYPPKHLDFASLRACSNFVFHWGHPASAEPPLLESGALSPRLAVVSPGISFEAQLPRALRAQGIELCTEMELGLELLALPSVVVTGSNGKSTTVSLIQHLFRATGIESILCGNIGTPVVSAAREQCVREDKVFSARSAKVVVVEASSYQLEQCQSLAPQVSVILNLSENHLERHGSLEAYGAAKAKIASGQGKDQVCVLNVDDSFCRSAAVKTEATRYWFGMNTELSEWPTTHTPYALVEYNPAAGVDRILLGENADGPPSAEISLSALKLIGLHNRANVAAALLALKGMKVDLAAHAKAIDNCLRAFDPLPHRLQLCASDDKERLFFNDSKSTTVASTVEALRTCVQHYPGRLIVVMIGGQAKRGSWAPLTAALNEVRDRVSELVFFGRDGVAVRGHMHAAGLDGSLRTFDAVHLRDAVSRVVDNAPAGSLVLFSPGCASFDEFSGFEARGGAFIRLVQEGVGSLASNQ
jgi:UDP-N-acetylmuramoylalanine--D-glutamate ligase